MLVSEGTPVAPRVALLAAAIALFCALAGWRVTAVGAAPPVVLYVNAAATGANDGLTWTDAYTDLQSALNVVSPAKTIWVATGTYTPGAARSASFTLPSGKRVIGGFAGTETVETERDPATNVTVLSADIGAVGVATDNSYHVVRGVLVNAQTLLDGFTVRGGYANGVNADEFGPGILVSGDATFRNLAVVDNVAPGAGGAGGGVYVESGSPTFEGVLFSDNQAHDGGGLYIQNATVTVRNSTFSGNSVVGAGGGVWLGQGSATLDNVTSTLNAAATQDGARANSAGGQLTVRNSIFYGDGGGGDEIGALLGSITIANSIVQSGCPSGSSCAAVSSANPQLGALAGHGGPTQTHAIPDGSLAVDAGSNATCATPTDQRGSQRPFDGDGNGTSECDLGAYEVFRPTVEFVNAYGERGENSTPGFAIVLSAPSLEEITVAYGAVGGNATGGGVDYTLPPSTATIPAGQSSGTANIGIVDDSLDENDETVIIGLSSPAGARLGTQKTTTWRILDNDPEPVIGFVTASLQGSEAAGFADLPILVTPLSGRTTSVKYAVSGGSATAGADFNLAPGTAKVGAGNTGSIKLRLIDDFLVEGSETVVVTISDAMNATLGPITVLTYTIVSNDVGRCAGRSATIVGTASGNRIVGTAGDDVIVGGGGSDVIDGRGGQDLVCGNAGDDKIGGGDGDDRIFGQGGRDRLAGGAGEDTLVGGAANDTLNGRGGDDQLNGGGGDDIGNGGGGNDRLDGGSGNDRLRGDAGTDRVNGMFGNDRLAGGPGTSDSCTGGPGADALLPSHGCEATAGVP